jgi:lipopolysaccharide transport system ATP-binding protein
VLAVGDTEFQKKCLGKMDNLAKSGRTVIYVSHNISSILSLCHKAIYLDSGKLLKVGKTSTTLDHYYRDTHKSSFDHEVHQKFPKENQMQLSTISSEYMKNTVLIKGKLKSERVIDNNSIGISIHSESGQLLGLLYSGPECYYQFKKGKNEFSLQISNINFTPGRYYIRMRIESRGEEIYWPKDDVSNFNITYLPDKMTGRSEIYSNGLTLLESDWK